MSRVDPRASPTNCLIIRCLFLVATLSSKIYYRNAKVFVGVLFFLTGLQEKGKEPSLIWWQLVIMYFGAGLNKFFEVDWRSGLYRLPQFSSHVGNFMNFHPRIRPNRAPRPDPRSSESCRLIAYDLAERRTTFRRITESAPF